MTQTTPRYRELLRKNETRTLSRFKNGSPNGSDTYVSNYDHQSISDVVVDRYHHRAKQGEIFNNPLNFARTRITSGIGFYQAGAYSGSGGSTTLSVLGDSRLHWNFDKDIELPVALDAETQFQALSRVNSPPFDFGEDALELRETLRFLRSPQKSLVNLVSQFRKRASKVLRKKRISRFDAKATADALADVWASYSFAAAPLIRSVYDGIDAISTEIVVPERLTARARKAWLGNDAQFYEQHTGAETFGITRNQILDYDVRSQILYQYDGSDGLAYKLGFRLSDWPETLWEILPLSFMVDRAVSIKQSISGLVNLYNPNVKILAASVTRRSERTTLSQWSSYNHSSYSTGFSGDVVTQIDYAYTRDVWTPDRTDLRPALHLRGLTRDLSSTLDLSSLLVKQLTSRIT